MFSYKIESSFRACKNSNLNALKMAFLLGSPLLILGDLPQLLFSCILILIWIFIRKYLCYECYYFRKWTISFGIWCVLLLSMMVICFCSFFHFRKSKKKKTTWLTPIDDSRISKCGIEIEGLHDFRWCDFHIYAFHQLLLIIITHFRSKLNIFRKSWKLIHLTFAFIEWPKN